MTYNMAAIKKRLLECISKQIVMTASWHDMEPKLPQITHDYSLKSLPSLVLSLHYFNFQLWHVEDSARRRDVDDSIIAGCKRKIDAYNQKRNDTIEEVDKCLYHLIHSLLPENTSPRHNTETLGLAVDRLSILALKIFHMNEQVKRTGTSEQHQGVCAEKLSILKRQRTDLEKAVLDLLDEYEAGSKSPLLYSQFKMYNDPALNPELYTNIQT